MIYSLKIIVNTVFFLLITASSFLFSQEKDQGTVVSNKGLTNFYFDKLSDEFKDVKVVGAGESTHGTEEFSVIRAELFKYLVLNYEYNTIFLEASYSSCLSVDNYIKGGEDDLYDVMVNLRLWPWQTIEMMSLIDWMKNYNSENPDSELSFVGIDMRYNYGSTIDELKRLNPKLQFFHTIKWDSISMAQKRLKIDTIKSITFSSLEPETNFKYQFLITQLNQFYEGDLKERPNFYRDLKMGQNILSYLEFNEAAKGMFWAHNGHIKKTWTGFLKKEGRAGGYLNSKLKDQYLALGQDFKIGAFHVFRPDSTSSFKKNGERYSFGTVSFDDFSNYSLVASLTLDSLPKYFSKHEIQKANSGRFIVINEIGAKYTPREYGKKARYNYSRYRNHKVNEFDGMIYIPKSTPTKMIKKK